MCAGHVNYDVGAYYFNNIAVKGIDYNQMMDSYVRSKAQQFRQYAASQQDGARSTLSETSFYFSINCLGIHGLEDMVQKVGQNGHPT